MVRYAGLHVKWYDPRNTLIIHHNYEKKQLPQEHLVISLKTDSPWLHNRTLLNHLYWNVPCPHRVEPWVCLNLQTHAHHHANVGEFIAALTVSIWSFYCIVWPEQHSVHCRFGQKEHICLT